MNTSTPSGPSGIINGFEAVVRPKRDPPPTTFDHNFVWQSYGNRIGQQIGCCQEAIWEIFGKITRSKHSYIQSLVHIQRMEDQPLECEE